MTATNNVKRNNCSCTSTTVATYVATTLLIALTALSSYSFSLDSSIILQPGSPIATTILPYEVYEILVPADSLLSGRQYKVISSYNEASNLEVIIKRKLRPQDVKKVYRDSDFNKRKGSSIGSRTMMNHRASNDFIVGIDGLYKDDPSEAKYEILRGQDGLKFLVFQMSVLKVSMHYDDELMYRALEVGLSLSPDIGNNSLI